MIFVNGQIDIYEILSLKLRYLFTVSCLLLIGVYYNLKSIAGSRNANLSIALLCREAYLSAFQGKSKVAIELKLRSNSHITENAIENIISKCHGYVHSYS